jgi:type IV secretory pathway VirB3-like protein
MVPLVMRFFLVIGSILYRLVVCLFFFFSFSFSRPSMEASNISYHNHLLCTKSTVFIFRLDELAKMHFWGSRSYSISMHVRCWIYAIDM